MRWMSASRPPSAWRSVHLRVAVGAEHAEAVGGIGSEQVAQERDRRRRRPVEVVEDEDDRSFRGGAVDQVGDGLEETGLLGDGLTPDGLGCIDGRDEATELTTVDLEVGLQRRVVQRGEPGAQGLGKRLVGDGQILLAPAEHHQGTLVVGPSGERRHQARLADAGFPGHEDRAPVAGGGLLERL